MRVLIAHASKHGATAGIAERIGSTLSAAGHEVDVRPVTDTSDVSSYDAFVVGSATYMGHWMKPANAFVHRTQEVLVSHPVWLFSSGPIGDRKTDDEGVDLRVAGDPKELPELVEAVHPRSHRVFFGALDPSTLSIAERAVRMLPAGRTLLPEGDFRDWADVDAWADAIADQLR